MRNRSTMYVSFKYICLYALLLANGVSYGQEDGANDPSKNNSSELFQEVTDENIDYRTQIKPVFSDRCVACHGALKQEAGLRLDTAFFAFRGGQSGAAVVPGDLSRSLVMDRVQSSNPGERMPPDGEPLKPDQVSVLKKWIQQNAKAPEDEEPEKDPRDHWAFKMPVTPELDELDSEAGHLSSVYANPIDAFLALEHRKQGLEFHRDAEPGILLRRVSIDLIGLPPTQAEIEAFIADKSNVAYEKVVQRLLDSPQHGERWGRHWMDIWRYSDWWGLGSEVRNSQKHMWHWRDWIIESLNANKGYDQMIREMLAADEMYPNDTDRLRASGFLARQYFKFNRTTWLDGVIEHTAKAMVGLTINCAKCHDHKYDPISQVDYYGFRAIFEPYQIRIDLVPGEIDPDKNGIPRAFDCNMAAKTFLHIRGDERNADETKPIEPSAPLALNDVPFEIKPVSLPLEAQHPGLRPFVFKSFKDAAIRKINAAKIEVEKASKNLSLIEEAELVVQTSATSNLESNADQLEVLSDETKREKSEEVEKAKLKLLLAEKTLHSGLADEKAIAARHLADKASTHNRLLDIARILSEEASKLERMVKLAEADKAVTTIELEKLHAAPEKVSELEKKRVIAAQTLQKARKSMEERSAIYAPLPGAHKTLESNVESEESRNRPFPEASSGRRTALANWITDPRNPLTARVAVNHIWMRHMGRPLVATTFDFGRKGASPTHRHLLDWLAIELIKSGWDMKHIHRLIVTSQAYRKSSSNAFAIEKNLTHDPENLYYWRSNSSRMDAQTIRDSLLYLAGELDLKMGGPSINVNDETSNRRSLYFIHSHNDHHKFLAMFDDANVLDCYRRADSIVPQQALALENSKLVADVSRKLLAKIVPTKTNEDFVRKAFAAILCVEPSDQELELVLQAYEQIKSLAIENNRENSESFARQQIVQSLLNLNDFITIR